MFRLNAGELHGAFVRWRLGVAYFDEATAAHATRARQLRRVVTMFRRRAETRAVRQWRAACLVMVEEEEEDARRQRQLRRVGAMLARNDAWNP